MGPDRTYHNSISFSFQANFARRAQVRPFSFTELFALVRCTITQKASRSVDSTSAMVVPFIQSGHESSQMFLSHEVTSFYAAHHQGHDFIISERHA